CGDPGFSDGGCEIPIIPKTGRLLLLRVVLLANVHVCSARAVVWMALSISAPVFRIRRADFLLCGGAAGKPPLDGGVDPDRFWMVHRAYLLLIALLFDACW